jgi:hypothetical protein
MAFGAPPSILPAREFLMAKQTPDSLFSFSLLPDQKKE